MNREVLVADLQRAVRLPLARLKKLALRIAAREKLPPGGLSLAFVDRATMRRLNRRHLRHDYDTDVLAFPLDGGLAGEIVISTEFAVREAERRGIPALEEVSRYVVHGLLHLAGYDDHAPKERSLMWKRQEAYVREISARGR